MDEYKWLFWTRKSADKCNSVHKGEGHSKHIAAGLILPVMVVGKWLPLIILFACVLPACTSVSGWGGGYRTFQDNHFRNPADAGKGNLRYAVITAVTDSMTFLPIAGAAVYSIDDDWDQRTSDWARDNNPIFGSEQSAIDYSDMTGGILIAEFLLTGALRDSKEPEGAFPRVLTYQGAGVLATIGTTDVMKNWVGRERPNGSDRESFPSGHASTSRALAVASNRNLENLNIDNERLLQTLQVANNLGAFTTAWARVEGGKHYPRDILVGMAIGNFFAVFFDEWLLNGKREVESGAMISFQPAPGGGYFSLSKEF